MNHIKTLCVAIACALGFFFAAPAVAGPYTDELGKCLVNSTNEADRTVLVRWMFAAISSHPAVNGLGKVSPAQVDEENKKGGKLFVKLMTESCLTSTQEALRYEGASALEKGFNTLGQVAGRELFENPAVAANLAGLTKYVDMKKLEKTLGPRK